MQFSVIVPFLDEENYIERCIKALLHQTLPQSEYELIFVDNGSTDRSVEIVNKYPRVKLLFEPRKNEYYARNKALRVTRGKIIAFTDADCQVNPNWLSELTRAFKSKDVGIVIGKRCFANSRSVFLNIIEDYENTKAEYVCAKQEKQYYFGYMNNMAIRSKIFKKRKLRVFPKNGDTEIIQRYLRDYPTEQVVYNSKIISTHSEVTAARSWVLKMFSYGIQNTILEQSSSYKSLSFLQNMNVAWKNATKNKYDIKTTLAMFFVLWVIKMYYVAGSVFARLSFSASPRLQKS